MPVLNANLCAMPVFRDQLQRPIYLPAPPQRIVSLVPSVTETLWTLGLEDEVVGITKFCVHPAEWFRTKTRIGGTKNVDLQKLKAVQPDLVIASKEENVRAQIGAIEAFCPVWVSDVQTLADALAMITSVGEMTERGGEADTLVNSINEVFGATQPVESIRAAYLIWKDPWMTVGGDTFIHYLLERAGFGNVFGYSSRYPVVTIDDLRTSGCECVLLSSEPYPFKEKHAEELRSLLPNTQVTLVDGEMFSWWGSRLLHAPAYFTALRRRLGAN